MANEMYSSATGMAKFKQAQAQGRFVEWVPFMARVDLLGLADSTVTGTFSPKQIDFFVTPQGSIGNGFTRPLTEADTSLEGGANQMNGTQEFIGYSIGVKVSEWAPDHIKRAICEYGSMHQNRGSSDSKFGPVQYWPCADAGITAQAAATTVANTTINPSTNGRFPMKQLPPEAWIYLPSTQLIGINLRTFLSFNVSANDLPLNAGGVPLAEYQRLVEIVMYGYRWSLV